jgi:hypothetical protein
MTTTKIGQNAKYWTTVRVWYSYEVCCSDTGVCTKSSRQGPRAFTKLALAPISDNLGRPRRYIRVGSGSDDPYFSPWFLVLVGLMASGIIRPQVLPLGLAYKGSEDSSELNL